MRGWTLIELLVVIAIIGILGTLGFINYRTFQANQVLNEGVSLVQSTLRAAQANATSGLKCGGVGGATWMVTFGNDTTFNLDCRVGTSAASTQRSYSLPTNIRVQDIAGSNCSTSDYPFSVNFSPLYGVISFGGGNICIRSQNSIIVTLTNTKTGESKNITVSKGGVIDAQK